MKTKIAKINSDIIEKSAIREFAKMITDGKLVAFPTETVYGLGANALDDSAVKSIFAVKNRPANNPLIAHVTSLEMANTIAKNIPFELDILFNAFWPGAFTVVLEKRECVPDSVTASGKTVAVRCPSHPIAHALIQSANVPIVAPSANLSGKPSPTCFEHVYEDLNGKISGIINGGTCDIGIESTVVIPTGKNKLRLLRPGAITPEMLQDKGFEIEIDKHILTPVTDNSVVASPGMLYRHYAPKAKMMLIRGNDKDVIEYINKQIANNSNCGVLCFDNESGCFANATVIEYGTPNNPLSLSHNLFSALRKFDLTDVEIIYARVIEPCGVGLGLYNRMLRAASFNVIAI